MYFMGDKIMDNFTSTINHDIMIKIYALNLIDTPVKTMRDNETDCRDSLLTNSMQNIGE